MIIKEKISIIVATYNRANDLKELFDSILMQSVYPNEVIIVDDTDTNLDTKKLVESSEKDFIKRGIALIYVRNPKFRSASIARNIGAEMSNGGIILFLDDDVVLSELYIEELLKAYENNPNAKGVQGYWADHYNPTMGFKLKNLFYKLFALFHFERDRCRILPSFNQTFPYPLTKAINCEWLSGCNQSYNKSIFNEFNFDEKLLRYSAGEDLDLSYNVLKRYPNSLFITPNAKLIHKISKYSRAPDEKRVYFSAIYAYYLFYKNIESAPRNSLIFYWSRLGLIIFRLFDIIYSRLSLNKFLQLKYQIKGEFFCIIYLNRIKKKDLEFFDDLIKY